MRKRALITGASRGIGAATALRLAAEGFDLIINYRENAEAAEYIVEHLSFLGCDAHAVKADISRESEVVHLFEQVKTHFGGLDVLVNNAGILFPQSRVEDMDAARISAVFATNVTGTLLCCKEAIKLMSTRHQGTGGVIVNISSAAARIGAAGEYVDYAASKGAVDTLTLGLATEVASEGIRVVAVRPGLVYTDIHASGGEPERVDRLKTTLPLQRGGRAEEVAAAVAWLVSDESSYVTGSFIDVSGGR